jgi:hypothetical protein
LQARLEPTKVEPLTRLHSNGKLLALPTNIKIMEVNGRGKHSSLFPFGNNYGCKMFIVQNPVVELSFKKF